MSRSRTSRSTGATPRLLAQAPNHSSESSRPTTPTTISTRPTVCRLMPLTVAVTAYRKIAPTAIRKSEVPYVIAPDMPPSAPLQPPISRRRRLCEHMFVRWSNLTEEADEQRRLPGYRDEAVVRHFDAPEALDTRFYEVRARSVLNRVPARSRMPFSWTINPYRGCSHACIFCFARPTHRYLGFDAGRDFEREIVVKVNAPEVLRRELARPSWKRERVALGTNTDPYQWVEGRYRLMVGIWEALRDAADGAGNPCSVLTKSPLLLRDLPLMLEIAERTTISASLSIPTLDQRAWRATEPHTPNPRARLEAVAELNRAGIPTGVLVAPLMPGINDSPQQLEPLLQGAIEAGAQSIGGVALHLRGEVKDVFMDWLRTQRPELVRRYEGLYASGAYAPTDERRRLADLVRRPGTKSGFRRLPEQRASPDPPNDSLGTSQQSLF